jgi:hypothetical protein
LGEYPGFDITGENGHDEAWMNAQHAKKLRNEPVAEPNQGPYWKGWSLGPLGYLIFGFDHSIMARGEGDEIWIKGNAMAGWEEAGIISVMQDTNGNGLPDDTWYELKGSQHGRAGHVPRYAVRYFYPFKKTWASGGQFIWMDNRGNGGVTQNFYPFFVPGESITYSGTIVAQGSSMTGYTDTHDTRFSIADAIQADGTPISLGHIDFMRVHGALTGGGFGGYSTEFGVPVDNTMPFDDPSSTIHGTASGGGNLYTFINDSDYEITVNLRRIVLDSTAVVAQFILPRGARQTNQYQYSPLIVEFSGGNAELAITGSTARFTSTGGGGI